MYLLINDDNTINFAGDHPIDKGLNFTGTRLVEFKRKKMAAVVGDVAPDIAWWNDKTKKVERDPRIADPRNTQAREKILQFYPVWRQMNVLRSGDSVEVEKMGLFIDVVRAWANDRDRPVSDLEKIIPMDK